MAEKIGLFESVSIAVGGMVGGGIFAVLGVVAGAAGPTSWLAFVLAGVVAACAGYSFVRLNDLIDGTGGPITYIEQFTGNTTLAGMAGWTFVIGYVGTMGLYAYAFGGYVTELIGVSTVYGVPLRPVWSLLAVASFVALNVLGAHASGRTEDVLVGLKVLILLVFGLGGTYYAFSNGELSSGLSSLGGGPIIAAAIAFVAFEGWELLMFDQDSIAEPKRTVRKAIYLSIAIATGLYVLVAIPTTNLLTPAAIQQHSETALAIAAEPFLGRIGFVLISVAALFSTGSALNATLFSASRLSKQMIAENLLPQQLERDDGDEPVRALLLLGVLTGGLVTVGSLNAISSFASLSFITIFGAISALALRERSGWRTAVVPAIGSVGAVGTTVALLWHLYDTEPGVFVTVLVLVVAVAGVELLYFERQPLEEWVEAAEG
ncbi:APC family permease [Salinigranum marinum]|uniref:APC family permease n=1 Tax=Salinigranum marinum TaxID=1515595 RepID=UPI002989E7DA|nr:APC family permease [Salinigranum marinum]